MRFDVPNEMVGYKDQFPFIIVQNLPVKTKTPQMNTITTNPILLILEIP